MNREVNQLYCGDNLQVLREHLAEESVDLIYLDPPSNSKRDYNLLFKSPKGARRDSLYEPFEACTQSRNPKTVGYTKRNEIPGSPEEGRVHGREDRRQTIQRSFAITRTSTL